MAGHGHSTNCTELFPPEAPKTGDIIRKVSKAKTISILFPPGQTFKTPAFLLGSSIVIL